MRLRASLSKELKTGEKKDFFFFPFPVTSSAAHAASTLFPFPLLLLRFFFHLLHKSHLLFILSLSANAIALTRFRFLSLHISIRSAKHWLIRTENDNGRRSWIKLQFIYSKSAGAIFSSQIFSTSSSSRFYIHLTLFN